MPPPTVYILCGLPFSGKTTFARALVTQRGFIHLDLDAMARAEGLYPEVGITDQQWASIFGTAHQQLANLLNQGKSVVFDAVNYDRVGRDRLRAIARQAGGSARVIYLDVPIHELERRKQDNQMSRYRPRVRDIDRAELVKEFQVPTVEESVLVFDGTELPAEWIEHAVQERRLTPNI